MFGKLISLSGALIACKAMKASPFMFPEYERMFRGQKGKRMDLRQCIWSLGGGGCAFSTPKAEYYHINPTILEGEYSKKFIIPGYNKVFDDNHAVLNSKGEKCTVFAKTAEGNWYWLYRSGASEIPQMHDFSLQWKSVDDATGLLSGTVATILEKEMKEGKNVRTFRKREREDVLRVLNSSVPITDSKMSYDSLTSYSEYVKIVNCEALYINYFKEKHTYDQKITLEEYKMKKVAKDKFEAKKEIVKTMTTDQLANDLAELDQLRAMKKELEEWKALQALKAAGRRRRLLREESRARLTSAY